MTNAKSEARASSDASPELAPTANELEVGYVRAVHGVHGALKVQLHDPNSRALRVGIDLAFRARGGGHQRLRAELVEVDPRPTKDGLRVRVHGVDTREAAAELKSHGVWIARADLPALGADEYYLADTIGREVVHVGGATLGKVISVTSNGPQDLFEIQWRNARGKKFNWLLPAVPGMVTEVEAARVVVDPPRGLMPESLEIEVLGPDEGAFDDVPQASKARDDGE